MTHFLNTENNAAPQGVIEWKLGHVNRKSIFLTNDLRWCN